MMAAHEWYVDGRSTGLFTEERLMFPRCTILKAGTVTGMALYVVRLAYLEKYDLSVRF
jgi:hypothetical protein